MPRLTEVTRHHRRTAPLTARALCNLAKGATLARQAAAKQRHRRPNHRRQTPQRLIPSLSRAVIPRTQPQSHRHRHPPETRPFKRTRRQWAKIAPSVSDPVSRCSPELWQGRTKTATRSPSGSKRSQRTDRLQNLTRSRASTSTRQTQVLSVKIRSPMSLWRKPKTAPPPRPRPFQLMSLRPTKPRNPSIRLSRFWKTILLLAR